ncbi:MAG: redox-regulated ATPase YchF [Candidatus Melainabacteria bacterium RIFCSPLOWO2_12_FULL_35_11]|nr:MAG: redox-regulated ATPase YchF [Candidatus Melainabacteria bacterium RIFCSPLOWO2_12_FULL_35_11]
MYRAGIVGLPNVGKSTLFNALIRNHLAEASNYPFCTIEPNSGIVNLPDGRLDKLAKIVKTNKIVPAAFEFVDIAGLVKGASKGEGLGNQFLSCIREVDAIVHVIRCFEDPNIIHVEGNIDPIRDIEIINIELALSDLQSIEKKIDTVSKRAKTNDKISKQELAILEKLKNALNENKSVKLDDGEIPFYKSLFFLSNKPVIFACNVSEDDFKNIKENKYVQTVENYAKESDSKCVPVCATLESELISFNKEERDAIIGIGKPYTGVDDLIRATFDLLGLTTYFTAGEKEVRAWTILKNTKAPQAAGVIHTDFEKGFIKAEVIKYDDLIRLGTKIAVREAGLARLEGKEYIVQDSDVIEFKFNV